MRENVSVFVHGKSKNIVKFADDISLAGDILPDWRMFYHII